MGSLGLTSLQKMNQETRPDNYRSTSSTPLSWGLIVCTFNRRHVLARCLRLAASQSLPPSVIAVVDASPDWENTRAEILSDVAADHPSIQWHYVPAETRSLTIQRNQGLKLVETDVVFLFDDDSLMYPDCAAEIMKIYQADSEKQIVGVNAVHNPVPPDQPDDEEALKPSDHSTTKVYGPAARMIRRALDADNIFIPYDDDFPRHEVPASVLDLHAGVVRLMVGWGMTYRREICLKEPFSDILRFYSAEEDTDMSYRASRHGLLMVALDARLCHLGSKGGRASAFNLAVSRTMNPLALHRLYSTDLARSRRRQRLFLARRFLILLCKDVYRRQWTFPNSRGAMFSLRMLDTIFGKSKVELKEWYPEFQRELMDAPVPTPNPQSQ